jgi:hypothetical protein
LQELLNSRKATVQQFLNTQEITAKARMEKISVGLIDLIVDKAMGVIV